MFNPTKIVIDSFIEQLKQNYVQNYGLLEPEYPHIIAFVARLALEKIANSDAPYHDLDHTIMVTEVGQEILKGKHIHQGGVTPKDWLHFIVSLLCHDIGYVRGVCFNDNNGSYQINQDGQTIAISRGATDASLTPHHVDRSKLFVEQRFGHVEHLDIEIIKKNIEHTRFPVPKTNGYKSTDDYPGLIRASDLIGQMGDINHARKVGALYCEFLETGTAELLQYQSAADLKEDYPRFFWQKVSPLIQTALQYLRETQDGKQWISNLYANVFAEEHRIKTFGSEN